MLEMLKKRVNELKASVDQSAARHNMLCGHLGEAQHMLDMAIKEADDKNKPEDIQENKENVVPEEKK